MTDDEETKLLAEMASRLAVPMVKAVIASSAMPEYWTDEQRREYMEKKQVSVRVTAVELAVDILDEVRSRPGGCPTCQARVAAKRIAATKDAP